MHIYSARATLAVLVAVFIFATFNRASAWDNKGNGFRDYPLGVLDGTAQVYLGKPDFVVTKLDQSGAGFKGGLLIGDHIIAANGKKFKEYDNNILSGGKGGPEGLGNALNRALGTGTLELTVIRGGSVQKLKIKVPRWGSLGDNWPMDDSERVQAFRQGACDYINQVLEANLHTGFGGGADEFSKSAQALALLASGDPKYKKTLKNLADKFANSKVSGSNWVCFFTGVFLAEYYLSTKDKSVLEHMQDLVTTLESRMNENGYIGHAGAFPAAMYGHDAGFNPVQSGCLWFFSLAQKCGIKVNQKLWDANADSLKRSQGSSGSVGYSNWARGGGDAHDRSSKTLLGLCIAQKRRKFRSSIADYLENNPGSLRYSHAISAPGVMDCFMATYMQDQSLYHELLNKWRWYFTLAEGPNHVGQYIGSKRNYGGDVYLKKEFIFNAMIGVVLSAPKQALYVYGGMPNIPGISPGTLSPQLLKVIKTFRAHKPKHTLAQLRSIINARPKSKNAHDALMIGRYVFKEQVQPYWQEILALYAEGDLYKTAKMLNRFINECGRPQPLVQEINFLETMLRTPHSRKVIQRGEIYHELVEEWSLQPYARPVIKRKIAFMAKDTSDIYGRKAAHAIDMLEQQAKDDEKINNRSEAEVEAARRAAMEL